MRFLRRVGRQLLAAATRITPESQRPWAEAMLDEFEAIESDAEALQWGIGSAFTLLCVSVSAAVRAELERGVTMSRVLVVLTILLLAVLWLATPVVRQGVSLVYEVWRTDWYAKNWKGITQRDVERVCSDPRWQNDPEALAYLALNESDPANADHLITQAVEREPKLGWAYLLLAEAHPQQPQTMTWIGKFRQYDGGRNALSSLVAAREIRRKSQKSQVTGISSAWETEMSHAFASPEYNDYLHERMNLQRAVMKRYEAGNPLSLLAVIYLGPYYPYVDIQQYADKLILEGTRTNDLPKYREVIAFAQRLYVGANTDMEQNVAKDLLRRSMGILAPKLEAQGRVDEAAQMAFQVSAINKDTRSAIENRDEYLLRTANVIHLATLFALISMTGILGTAAVWLIARFRNRAVRLPGFIAGCAMVLTSSLTIVYVSYRPYEQIYHNFMDGQFVSPKLIASFGSIVDVPFLFFHDTWSFSADALLWQIVFVVCVLALIGIAASHLPIWRRSEVRSH